MVRYVIKFGIIIGISAPIYFAIRKLWLKKACDNIRPGNMLAVREIAMGCFVLFHIGLLALTLEGEYGNPLWMAQRGADRLVEGDGGNLVPFRSIGGFFSNFDLDAFMVNIVGNIVMFMPWGFGMILLWGNRRKIFTVCLHSLLLPLFIESAQLFIGRSVDVDDLLLNFIGSCLVACLYALLAERFPQIKASVSFKKIPARY